MEETKFISIEESLSGKKPETAPIVPPVTPPTPPIPPGDPPTFAQAFETSAKEINPEFVIDKGFDKMDDKARFDYMKENLATKETVNDDPFIESYLKAKKQGISQDDYVKQRNVTENIKSMPSRDFLINSLAQENGVSDDNPNGWTKEDIETHIDGMNRIDMDMAANKRKEAIYTTIDADNESYRSVQKTKVKEQSETANSGPIKETIEKLFTDMSSAKDIGGIPHTAADQEEFKKMFTDVVSLNPETGYPRTSELLNDDKVLYEMMYLYHKANQKGNGGLRNFLSTFKEEYKQEILDKTRLAPREQEGSTQTIELPKPEDYV